MNQPARAQEPSMEEILASIRRIIADDDASKTPAGEFPQAEPPPPPPQRPAQPLPPVQHVQPPVQAAPPPPPPPAPSRIEREIPPPPPIIEEPVAFGQETVAEQSADILDLTESMTMSSDEAGPSPQFRTIDGSSDLGFDEAQEPSSPPAAPFPPAPPRLDDYQERLLSNTAGAAVDSAFHALAQTVLSQNARTLEDLVRDMLRPMLKSWLDDNLPGMVERMVRAEIERVSRGRLG